MLVKSDSISNLAITSLESKKELICVLSFIGNKSLQLRTRSVNSIENNLKFCKLIKLFSNHLVNGVCFSVIKVPLRKRSSLALLTDTRAATARLLVMGKYTATFLLKVQKIWVYLI